MSAETTYTFHPIATIRSANRYRFEAPRQATFAETPAFVEFMDDQRLSLAAADLAGFERIWLIGCFSLNWGQAWKAKVRPPVSPDGARYGVFATRSPHRPNPIALSAVKLLGIEANGLRIGPCDLLDGTPIFDIKPYIPAADAFPDSKAGWRDAIAAANWAITFEPTAMAKANWLNDKAGLDLINFCHVQLAVNPLDKRRKRILPLDATKHLYSIGCRTWQIHFTLESATRQIRVTDIRSNYAAGELAPGAPDPYTDKSLHRAFLKNWHA